MSSHECECRVVPGFLSCAPEQIVMAAAQGKPREEQFTGAGGQVSSLGHVKTDVCTKHRYRAVGSVRRNPVLEMHTWK